MNTLKLLSLSIVAAALATTAYAQGGGRQGGGNYNPATETTLTGTIDSVKTMPSQGQRRWGASPGSDGIVRSDRSTRRSGVVRVVEERHVREGRCADRRGIEGHDGWPGRRDRTGDRRKVTRS